MFSISASKITTYHSCPRKFYLQYILNLKEPVESPWLELGNRIHSKLANGVFDSEDITEKGMLQNGKKFLDSMPPKPICETSYSDSKNPGRFYGEVLGQKAVGIFDVHWSPDISEGADYKTGNFFKSFTSHFDMQAWILNELFKQKYDQPLKRFCFAFLKDGSVYEPECIKDEKASKKIEKSIKKVLFNIEEGNYPKKCGNLCDKCGLNMFCSMDL